MSSSATSSARTDTARLGRLLYETRLPGPDRRLVRKVTQQALVSTLASIVAAGVLLYFFQSVAAAVAVPIPAAAILANVRDMQTRRFSIALLLVIYGAAFLVLGAVFPTVFAPQLGLNPDAYPGLAL